MGQALSGTDVILCDEVMYVDGGFVASRLWFNSIRSMQIRLSHSWQPLCQEPSNLPRKTPLVSVLLARSYIGTVRIKTADVPRLLSVGTVCRPISQPRIRKLMKSYFDYGICTVGRGNISAAISFKKTSNGKVMVSLRLIEGHHRVRSVLEFEKKRIHRTGFPWSSSKRWEDGTNIREAIDFDTVPVDVMYMGEPSVENDTNLTSALNKGNDELCRTSFFDEVALVRVMRSHHKDVAWISSRCVEFAALSDHSVSSYVRTLARLYDAEGLVYDALGVYYDEVLDNRDNSFFNTGVFQEGVISRLTQSLGDTLGPLLLVKYAVRFLPRDGGGVLHAGLKKADEQAMEASGRALGSVVKFARVAIESQVETLTKVGCLLRRGQEYNRRLLVFLRPSRGLTLLGQIGFTGTAGNAVDGTIASLLDCFDDIVLEDDGQHIIVYDKALRALPWALSCFVHQQARCERPEDHWDRRRESEVYVSCEGVFTLVEERRWTHIMDSVAALAKMG